MRREYLRRRWRDGRSHAASWYELMCGEKKGSLMHSPIVNKMLEVTPGA